MMWLNLAVFFCFFLEKPFRGSKTPDHGAATNMFHFGYGVHLVMSSVVCVWFIKSVKPFPTKFRVILVCTRCFLWKKVFCLTTTGCRPNIQGMKDFVGTCREQCWLTRNSCSKLVCAEWQGTHSKYKRLLFCKINLCQCSFQDFHCLSAPRLWNFVHFSLRSADARVK